MKKTVEVTEFILRDAHQSLLATRLALKDIIPACADLGRAGYWSVECWGGATFDSCIRFLNEDPWERLRTLRKLLPNTRLQMLLRGQSLLGYQHYPDDVVEHFVQEAAGNGIDVFRTFDALNDIRNLHTSVAAVKRAGKHAQGTIAYTVSPVHSVSGFVDFARQLKQIGCDSICIMDVAGLLKPQAAYDLVKGIKRHCGPEMRVHLHANPATGVALVAYMKALEAGADAVDIAVSSLLMGAGHNPTESFIEMLEGSGVETHLDLEHIRHVTRYFATLRPKYQESFAEYVGADAEIVQGQIPPSMMATIESQLSGQAAAHRYQEVLAEIPRVRADCGFPPLFTPISQILGTQAVFNVLSGRYKMITGEFADLVLGYYGAIPGERNPEVVTLVEQHAKKIAITSRPADLLKPAWHDLCAAATVLLRLVKDDEDVLTYAMFPQAASKFFGTRGSGPRELSEQPVRTASFSGEEPAGQKSPVADARGPVTYVITLNGKEHRVTVSAGGTAERK
jgi:methylmalonyl-CoA carboxyltransferase 5S subunit